MQNELSGVEVDLTGDAETADRLGDHCANLLFCLLGGPHDGLEDIASSLARPSESHYAAALMSRNLVLLSNDDGYQARGINTLREALSERFDVVVCAPASEQSAASHALTLSRPLRLREHEENIYSVDGTPADCVYVVLHSGTKILPRRPDLVISGLNHGVNLGSDVFYSGTVAAAREGALKGVSSLAVSADHEADLAAAARVSVEVAEAMLTESRDKSLLLNVNFPPGDQWPVRATRLGTRHYTEGIEYRRDPRGAEYLWIGGANVEHGRIDGADTGAFDEGIVGVTPLALDLWSERDSPDSGRVVDWLRRERGHAHR